MSKTIVINSETLGRGSDEIGKTMMGSFLRKLWGAEKKPNRIIFFNSAVNLLAQGSFVLDALDGLFKAKVDLIACGTCVTYFKLNDKIVVGRVSDMQEIVTTLTNSKEVITI